MTVPEYILTRKAVATLASVLAAVALLFAASPAAAQQTTDSTINYTIEPANRGTPSGGVQTYSINVVDPNEGIATYSEVIVNVTDTSVANITPVTETRTAGSGDAEIRNDNNSVFLRRALLGDTLPC